MTAFSRSLPPYRLATTNRGDTIQDVAGRELGDQNRWVDLVWINNLSPPYITDDEARVAPGVLLSGSFIKIPSIVGVWRSSDPVGQVFERDVLMESKLLQDNGSGDFSVVSGSKNLVQQLQHRIATPTGQMPRYPAYGCSLHQLIGKMNGPAMNILAAGYAKASILSEYRVRSIKSLEASADGDGIQITATVTTIAGGSVDVVSG